AALGVDRRRRHDLQLLTFSFRRPRTHPTPRRYRRRTTMPRYRDDLPQLATDRLFLTDGGIETTLIFDDGFDLPDFAAFPLLETEEGRAALTRYFDAYAAIAVRDRVGIVLETPT